MTARLDESQKNERKKLFGTWDEGFNPLRPYAWKFLRGDDADNVAVSLRETSRASIDVAETRRLQQSLRVIRTSVKRSAHHAERDGYTRSHPAGHFLQRLEQSIEVRIRGEDLPQQRAGVVGAGQIVYGTDYPFGSFAKHLAGLRESGCRTQWSAPGKR